MATKHELIKFKDGELVLDVDVSPEQETVQLSLEQMSKLFEKNKSTISRHISNIYEESELDKQATVAKNAIVQIGEQ